MSGVAQLGFTSVIAYAIGTCHLKGNAVEGDEWAPEHMDDCDPGRWDHVYYAQLLSLLCVMVIPTEKGGGGGNRATAPGEMSTARGPRKRAPTLR